MAAAAPLVARRWGPLPVLGAVAAANLAHGLRGGVVSTAEILALFVAVYTTWALSARRVAGAGVLVAGAALVPLLGALDRIYFIHWPVAYVGLALAASLGEVRRRLDRHASGLEGRTAELDRQRRSNARQGAAEERRRIARELHDLVAHGVSLMVLQAGAARRARDKDPARAEAALAAIEESGREAMAELQRLFAALGADAASARARLPGASEIPSLVERFKGAGLEVDLRVEGELSAVSQGLGLSVYRVAQEALTNALKHSEARRAALRVAADGREVVVEVADPGPPRRGPPISHGGHGHVGMRERVSLYGGALRAGPDGDSGYRVEARFPLEAGR